MDDIKLVIFNSHQFFFGLMLLGFSVMFLQDLRDFKENSSLEKRGFLTFIFSAIGIGTFFVLYQSWGIDNIFLVVEFTIFIILALVSPKYAVGFLIYLSLSRPWETFDDPLLSSMPRDISILALLSLSANKILKKEIYFRFNLGTFLLLGFALWMFLSGFFSSHVELAVRMYIEVLTKGVIVFILIQNGINKSRDMLTIKFGLVIAILEKFFVSFYMTFLTEKNTIVEGGQRLKSVGILSNSNDIAAIFVLAIPFVYFFILKTRIRPLNLLFAFLSFIIMSGVVWTTQSRGAVLALAASVAVVYMIKIKNIKTIALIGSLAMIGALGSFKLMSRNQGDVKGSTSNRVIYWKAGMNMAVRNPIFGVGFWGYNRNFVTYAIDGKLGTEGKKMTAHSSWVVAISEGGFLGLGFFAGLWIYAGLLAWKVRREFPEYISAIVGYGVAISFLSHTYLLYPYILLAMVITDAKMVIHKRDGVLV